MAKREEESIREFLTALYPTHPELTCVDMLEAAGFRKLSELERLTSSRLSTYLPVLFCLALHNYLLPGSGPVISDCTSVMDLTHTRKTVRLKAENVIPPCPTQYSPMFDKDHGPPRAEAGSGEADPDGDELSLVDAARILSPEEPGLLELEMITFKDPAALKALWCSCNGSKLLVRKDYLALTEQVEAYWESGANAVLLLGVPGIGKTGFVISLLLSLIEKKKPVVLHTKGGRYYFFEPQPLGGPNCYKLQDDSVLLDSQVYFLADGRLPQVPEFACNSLLASTPTLANYKDYSKDGRNVDLLLPVWSAAEIALAWQEIHDPRLISEQLSESTRERAEQQKLYRARQGLTLAVVKDRYRKWGGTARYVLAKPHVDLDEIIRGLQSIQATVEAASKQVADGDHPSHKLVHMKVRPGYESYEYVFASSYVAEAARRKLKQTTSQSLRLFLTFRGLQAHGANGLKGIIFQDEFKHIAKQTKSFQVRQVFQDINVRAAVHDVVFEFGDPMEIENLASLPSPPPVNRLIRPASKIEESIDAMRIVRKQGEEDILELHQVTISSDGIKYSAVLSIMQKFRIPPSRTVIYIDTTAELFPGAGYQNWRRSRNLVLRDDAVLRQLDGITQYVLNSDI